MSAPAAMSPAELYERLSRVPRVRLAHLPTPLEELPRLSRTLGGPTIWIKRDDCTGLAFGGNKTRHNEFIFGLVQERGTEVLVWGAGSQSNNCRQTAAACAKLGIQCHLVLSTTVNGPEPQGNLLLDYMFGAKVEFRDKPLGPELFSEIEKVADAYRANGRRVFSMNDPAVKARASLGYAMTMAEIVAQCSERSVRPAAVYFSSAGVTAAGVFLGKKLLGFQNPARAIAPIVWPWAMEPSIAESGNHAAAVLGIPACLDAADIDLDTGHVGRAYGDLTEAGMEAIRLMAQTEGILLEPVYTAKAMAALIGDIRRGRFGPDQHVVFIHTGGTPVLFALQDELQREFVGRSR